ncbi:hypothetical protein AHIS1_p075 [Acaryochloris phage A-HIS1]|nr:hypothetical protein AHIS1_p075 [Acaryochloris phage A-HIS1]
MTVTTIGPDPKRFSKELFREVLLIINSEMLTLNREIVKDSPADVGLLKNSWNFVNATAALPLAVLGTSSSYFLPVEMGRAPGKGISAEGQQSVAAWANRVLSISGPKAKGFAFLLSQKYKREGRKAVGFAGLAKPGTIPSGSREATIPEIAGGKIDITFRKIERRLEAIPPIT